MSEFSTHAFCAPSKVIKSQSDVEKFNKSGAARDILGFIKRLAESVIGRSAKNDADFAPSPLVHKWVAFMNKLFDLVDEVPPIKQPMRFGNKAFRTWHERLHVLVPEFLLDGEVLTGDNRGAEVELLPYFLNLFGDATRMDYGTGHELNFVIIWLLFDKLGLLNESGEEDLAGIILVAFTAYIRTMRRLQTEYMLEPAGSHGVWGLDDYHCLLFLFGAAQLSTPSTPRASVNAEERINIRPNSIHDDEILREYSSEFIYLEGIHFIKTLKGKAPFAETSPMLNDISAVSDWGKICSGLMKLFQGEVMNKLPVVQHLLFGSLLNAKDWALVATATTDSAWVPPSAVMPSGK